MGGLSADLYSFDWVITSYLLIKQFKSSGGAKQKESQASPTNELAAEQTVVADILESDSSEEEEDSDDEKGSYVDDIEKCSSFAARHSLESVVVHNKKEISGKNSFRLNDSTFASNTSTTTANTARRDTKRSTATTYIDDFPATYKGVEEYNTTLSPTPTMYANFTPLYSPASHKITCEMCLAPIHGSNYPHKCEKKVEDDV
ncbi:hypothetical protein BDF20DRAFT_458316 [Mycotypha africana]|uniref:uncharacterized protein n=1 Tax=Mycotypha africana TaxID=64632 RepID=UPI002301D717|nr:uncharacterized protein BDF20DRAFT_458316 [Mycotypha africana]KAI8982222.1 hypothetical protein BDF20DRAFT_458316 [Mycotypha africana]